ncbi:MAG: hypothetical protein ACJA0Y_001299 [Maricaulis maris]
MTWRKPWLAEVRHEALSDDLRSQVAPVMSMLGLEWEDGQALFFETERARGRILRPGADPVTRPLCTRSCERGRKYELALSDPSCEPLCNRARAWGYDTGPRPEDG